LARRKKYGFSFSWKRATGISNLKRQISRKTGIPLTRSGRHQKIGRMMTGGGCLVYIFTFVSIICILLFSLLNFLI